MRGQCERPGCRKPAVHLHHLIPKQVLKREGARRYLADRRILLPLCFDCHFNHEAWSRRLRREDVPASAWEVARELGEWAVVRLERDYPMRERTSPAARTPRAAA